MFDPKDYPRGARAGVLGLGRSGQAAVKLLVRKGFKVLASDSRPKPARGAGPKGLPACARLEWGGHSRRLLDCAFVVKSPGLKPGLEILARLKEAGVHVFSELETALAFSKARELVLVTGTNGKSTTTALAGAVFRAGLPRGRHALVGGNLGVPASAIALKAGRKDVLVLEASSYQLEDSTSLRPAAAAVLNLTADHLDHHGSMGAYVAAKAKAFAAQQAEDACVFNADDAIVRKISRECPSQRLYFGAKAPGVHAWKEGGKLRFRLPGWKKEIALAAPPLPGRHNEENALAAGLLAFSRAIKPAAVAKAFKAFRGIEHRIEECGVVSGVRCVNDSKATNVDSTLVALQAFEPEGKRLLLILGGLHKGSPYAPLKPWIERTVKGVFTIGSAARRIEEELSGLIPVFPCGTLETAVKTAFQVAQKGDILLLSPACASFDQFRDFEERGRRFKELVRPR